MWRLQLFPADRDRRRISESLKLVVVAGPSESSASPRSSGVVIEMRREGGGPGEGGGEAAKEGGSLGRDIVSKLILPKLLFLLHRGAVKVCDVVRDF